MRSPKKHLVLDASAIVNFWLNPEAGSPIARLFQAAETSAAQLWVAAVMIPTLEYVSVRRLKEGGVSATQARLMVNQLMENLLKRAEILSCFGFEQADIYAIARDFEDAQIAAAARSLAGQQVCIVTEDDSFDALGELPCKTPGEAANWLTDASVEATSSEPMPFIDLAAQQAAIRPQLERNIETVLRHGQYIMGPEIKQLEERLTEYVGVKHCITVSDGTKALLIAMMALGIKPGDEVITTPFTFIATGEMIALLGAVPVFVDIDPRTYNIDPGKIEAAITPKTKAIVPVSLYGQCADMDAINTIAEKHGLPVIEDAAQSFGATYKGKKSCALSTIGSTSFFPSKPLGCYGDGGALFTNDDKLAKLMREIRLHGQDRRYHHPIIGINGRMDTLQAAIVLAKMDIFDQEVKARAEIGARYTELLNSHLPQAGHPPLQREGWGGDGVNAQKITPPHITPHNTSVYAQYTILVENREAVQKKLNEVGIPTAVHYPIPLNLQPAFAHLNKPAGSFPVSEEIAKHVVSLPMGPDLTQQDQLRVTKVLLDSFKP